MWGEKHAKVRPNCMERMDHQSRSSLHWLGDCFIQWHLFCFTFGCFSCRFLRFEVLAVFRLSRATSLFEQPLLTVNENQIFIVDWNLVIDWF